jgi:hypothetical protein
METCMKHDHTDEAYELMEHGSGNEHAGLWKRKHKSYGSMKLETCGNMKRLMPYET